jgi:hypothetical protein
MLVLEASGVLVRIISIFGEPRHLPRVAGAGLFQASVVPAGPFWTSRYALWAAPASESVM